MTQNDLNSSKTHPKIKRPKTPNEIKLKKTRLQISQRNYKMDVFMLRDYGILNTRGGFLSHVSHSRSKVIHSVRRGFELYVLLTVQ